MNTKDSRRKHKRYAAQWKSAVLFDKSQNRPVFHTQTQDLSLGGTAIYSEHGDLKGTIVTLLLAGPPRSGETAPKVIKLRALVVSSTYSEAQSAHRLGLSFVKSDEDTLALLGQVLESGEVSPLEVGSADSANAGVSPAPVPASAPVPVSAPAPVSGGLSRLERLKQLAEAKQQEVPKADPVDERNLLISLTLERICKYLKELVENLEVVKPPLAGVYTLAAPGVPPLEGLAWQRGRVDFRSKNIAPQGERYEQVMLYYKLGAPKPMRITREVPAHERLKQDLEENKIEFQTGEERNERGSTVRVTFHFPCEVDAQLIFKADFDTGAISLAMQHVGRFGFLDYQLPPDVFTDQALEELAGYILGEVKTLGSLQKRK